MDKIDNQPCPICHKSKCALTEDEQDIPYFGKVFIFSMACSECGFHKADVEPAETHEPTKYTFVVESEDDLNVRIVKSSEATVKIPFVVEIVPGAESEGFVTNVEGLLTKVKDRIASTLDDEEDKDAKVQAWKLIKKLNKAMMGRERLKIIIEDPTGNSAIISDKAEKKKL
jgi:zinc finger protein